MDGPFGKTGGARAVEPEGGVVFVGFGRLSFGRAAVQGLIQRPATFARLAHQEHMFEILQARAHRLDLVPQLGSRHQHPRPAVVEQVNIFVGREHGVHGHGHRAEFDGPEEGKSPLARPAVPTDRPSD